MKKFVTVNRIAATLFFALICTFMYTASVAQAKPGDGYSADAAIKYADSCFKKSGNTYVKSPSSKYGDDLCAGYVSQCLREGGMSTDSTWYWNSKTDTASAWRVCSTLYSYLRDCGYSINYSPTASDIKPGDVLFYYLGGRWGHCAICVGKKSDGTPMVNAYNNAHYHFTYWTMGYKTCVVSMESRTAKPTISESLVSNGKKISIKCDTDDAAIYYTTDGSTPTKSSNKYDGAFTVKANCTVKAIAKYSSYKKSKTAHRTIDIEKTVSNGNYYLCSAEADKLALGVNDASTSESALISLMSSSSEQYNRKFKVKYLGDGHYKLTALHSGLQLSEKTKNTLLTESASTYTSSSTGIDNITTESAVASSESAITSTENTDTSTTKEDVLVENNSATKTTGTLYQSSSTDTLQQWNIKFASSKKYYIKNRATSDYLSVASNLQKGTTAYTQNTKQTTGQTWKLSSATTSKMKISLYETPTALKASSSKLTLSGLITSNYKILKVRISILNIKSKTVDKVTVKPNSKKCYLYKLGQELDCSKLSSGKYRLRITAYDSSKQTKTLANKTFQVS